jgi:hypothetical protein
MGLSSHPGEDARRDSGMLARRRSIFISSMLATLLSLAYAAIALAGDAPGPGFR